MSVALNLAAGDAVAEGRAALAAGDPATAAQAFHRQAQADPTDFESRYWLYSALLAAGAAEQARQALDEARTLHGVAAIRAAGADMTRFETDKGYCAQIGLQLYATHMMGPASVALGRALDFENLNAQSLLSYGLSLQHQGRMGEAIDVFAAAADIFKHPELHQFLIYPQLVGEDSDARHAQACREWAGLYAPAPPSARHANPALAGRKLRIGYLAPNFAGSQLRQFIAPVLESHDPETVTVTLYPASAETETTWPEGIEVHPIGQLSDDEAADLIRRDGIDVLGDCWGHSSGCRLGVFARRPAPVQFAWINFLVTTGLEQIDYVLHADDATPANAHETFTEDIWTLGPVFNAFRPAAGRLPPAPTPALKAGHVTFGSFNNPAKLSDPTLDAWAAVLRRDPSAVLRLKYRYFDDPVLQRATRARFAARGVAPERIEFEGQSSGEAYFRAFAEIDLMLDAWPAPGSTTTLDALSNGVPVLTMIGPQPNLGALYARAILRAAGRPELVTVSPEEFVDRAIELTGDLGRLDALRARVRPDFEASPLCDEPGFTRNLEAAFGQMFDRWRGQAAT
jgi:predicted O-linked N-acetylglucosamine transferase (SPINDLY family)